MKVRNGFVSNSSSSSFVVWIDGKDFRSKSFGFVEDKVDEVYKNVQENIATGLQDEYPKLMMFCEGYGSFSEGLSEFIKQHLNFRYIKEKDLYISSFIDENGVQWVERLFAKTFYRYFKENFSFVEYY